MSDAAHHRLWPVGAVWLALVCATLAGFFMAEGLFAARTAASLAFILAAIKIHLVFGQYMELGWQHRPLRQFLALWLAVVTILLLATYWLA